MPEDVGEDRGRGREIEDRLAVPDGPRHERVDDHRRRFTVFLWFFLGDDDRNSKPLGQSAQPPDSIDELRRFARGEVPKKGVLDVDKAEDAVVVEKPSHAPDLVMPHSAWLGGRFGEGSSGVVWKRRAGGCRPRRGHRVLPQPAARV
ncbi:MAG TPA: hypothetical protein VLA87_07440 [Gaiellaceae bacterium]|nr:hypothetical protein [Gaiellaceae bacterium]